MRRDLKVRWDEGAILRSRELGAVVKTVVDAGAAIANELAPDDPSSPEGESLAGSFTGEVMVTPRGVVGRITSSNFKAPFYEFGTVDTAAQPMLRPAADRLGLEPAPDPDGGPG